MDYASQKKNSAGQDLQQSALTALPLRPAPLSIVTPRMQRQAQVGQQLVVHTLRPVTVQRQQVEPVFEAAQLQREAVEGLSVQRQALQAQIGQQSLATGKVEAALQRQAVRQAPVAPLNQKPITPSAWVQAARLEVQRVQDPAAPDQTRWLGGADRERHVGTLRSIGHGLAQGFKTDRGPAVQRYAEYGDGLATLQRQALTGSIPRMVLAQVSPSERPHLQRAVDEALQRQQEEEANDASALHLHSLQRQLAELDDQALTPVHERIRARRGGGTPLPAAVQRHLEQGLNHDLSGVRIHDDAEADGLAKNVNALAFTTGTDIYFRSGQFRPNTQTGLELLAHEVTHTVQQSRGQVGRGVDPDAGLEQEARRMGARLTSSPTKASGSIGAVSPLTNTAPATPVLQRQYEGPILTPALTQQQVFAHGLSQPWTDTKAAITLTVTGFPAQMKAHYAGMPQALLQGAMQLIEITLGGLAAGTVVGGLIGAVFGGPAGAVLGAEAGFELANLALAAWGLKELVASLLKAAQSLQTDLSRFASQLKTANGRPEAVRAASQTLSHGLMTLLDGVLLALTAVLLKRGLKAFGASEVGQKIGAASEQSPTVRWLRARQGMTSTRTLIDRTRTGGSASGQPALAGTSGAAVPQQPPTRAPASTSAAQLSERHGPPSAGAITSAQMHAEMDSLVQRLFRGNQRQMADLSRVLTQLSPADLEALYMVRNTEQRGLTKVISQLKVGTQRPAALQAIRGAASRVRAGQDVVLEPGPSTGFPEFPDTGMQSVDIDLATRANGTWREGVQFYSPRPAAGTTSEAIAEKIVAKAEKQLRNSITPVSTLEVDLSGVSAQGFPMKPLPPTARYRIIIHFSDRTVVYHP